MVRFLCFPVFFDVLGIIMELWTKMCHYIEYFEIFEFVSKLDFLKSIRSRRGPYDKVEYSRFRLILTNRAILTSRMNELGITRSNSWLCQKFILRSLLACQYLTSGA